MLKFLFALITVGSPLVMLAAAARVFRLPYKARWFWVILSFVGFASVSFDWETSQVTTNWAMVNLLGFSIAQTPPGTGHWIWSFTIPVGAVLVFLNRPKANAIADPSNVSPAPPPSPPQGNP